MTIDCVVAFEVHGHETVVDWVVELALMGELLEVELTVLELTVELLEVGLTELEVAALVSEMEELIVVGDTVEDESLTACLLVTTPLRKKIISD